MTNSVYTVSTLIQSIKTTLELNDSLRAFYLKGEISNFTAHRSGHWYFSLKDEGSKITCVMFQGYTKEVDFMPKEGDSVLVRASITVYPVQGSLQCSVFSMQNAGIGDLYVRYERLKRKLYEQGCFDDSRKKPLPMYPEHFAIITGQKTAALQDILKTFHLRWPMARLTILECLVQGADAPTQIIRRLKEADQLGCDVIILARGGGSIEDLWAFNDEQVALTMLSLRTPIITGIGHETDTTIADLVADLRAPTPTGAVQLAVRNHLDVLRDIESLANRLEQAMQQRLLKNRHQIRLAQEHPKFKHPELFFQAHRASLSLLGHQLIQTTQDLKPKRRLLDTMGAQLSRRVDQSIQNSRHQLSLQKDRLGHNLKLSSQKRQRDFAQLLSLLNAYSPLNSLQRGYSLTYQDDHLIRSIEAVELQKSLRIQFKDGHILALATGKESHHE